MASDKVYKRPLLPGARSAADLETENIKLRKGLAETRMERDVLKKSERVLRQGVAARYAFMRECRLHFHVEVMSRLFSVSRVAIMLG